MVTALKILSAVIFAVIIIAVVGAAAWGIAAHLFVSQHDIEDGE